MIRTYQLVCTATPQRLSDVYGDGAGVVNAAHDIPYRQIIFQVEAANVYLGADATVSTTKYGLMGDTTSNNKSIPSGGLGPFETGPLKLSDFWVVGAALVLGSACNARP